MKIHTNNLTAADVWAATSGLPGVYAEVKTVGSRSHARGLEVTLEGTSSRLQNNNSGDRAATWDEWGIVMKNLFRIDPVAVWGSIKTPAYADEEDFDYKTGDRFETLTHLDQHKNHNWKFVGIPREQECQCGAVRRF